jgi:RNA polymerase sigma factor (sigma-70 family)
LTPSPADVAGTTDAELVSRVAGGDRDALAAIFDRYAGHLLAFCRSIVRNQADADDCLQDVFVVAATRLDGLRQPDRLRSRLFAVARHTCLARIERDGRALPTDDVADDPGPDADPAARGALDADLAAMVDDAMGGLAPRDRLVLDLADRQGLSTDEVAGALGMAAPSAHKVLVRARATARRSLGVALVARSGQGDCRELAAVLGEWDGTLTPLLRKRVSRHIEHCVVCASEEQRLAASGALLGAGAVVAVPIGLRAGILRTAGRVLGHPTGAGAAAGGRGVGVVGDHSGNSTAGNSTADGGWVAGWPPPYDGFGTGWRRRRVAGAAVIAAVVIAAAVLGAVQPWSSGASVARQATVSSRSAPPTPRTSTTASSTMPPPTAAPALAPAPSSSTGTSASTAPKARRTTGSAPPAATPTGMPTAGSATTAPSSSTTVPAVTTLPSTTVPSTIASPPPTSPPATTTTTTVPATTTTTTTTVPVIQ